jgi:hypothetical protein
MSVNFPVMQPTDPDSKFIVDLATKRARPRETQMVGCVNDECDSGLSPAPCPIRRSLRSKPGDQSDVLGRLASQRDPGPEISTNSPRVIALGRSQASIRA